MTRGEYEELDGNWSNTAAACATDRIFAITNGQLYAIATSGEYTQLEGTWDPVALCAVTPAALLSFERSGTLYRVSTENGAWTELDGTYANVRAAAACGGNGYVIDDVSLYRVPLDGAWAQLDGSWDTVRMTALGSDLFMFERSGSLYRAATSGGWTELDGTWSNTTACCSHAGRLYVMDGGALYDVDPATGAYEEINRGWTSQHLVSCGDAIYTFEESGSLFRIKV